MTPATIAIANIILPEVFALIRARRQQVNPATGQPFTYAEALEAEGLRLDAEHIQLMSDLAKDLADGAV